MKIDYIIKQAEIFLTKSVKHDSKAPFLSSANPIAIDVMVDDLPKMWDLPQLKALLPLIKEKWKDDTSRVGTIWIGNQLRDDMTLEDLSEDVGALEISLNLRFDLGPEEVKEYLSKLEDNEY